MHSNYRMSPGQSRVYDRMENVPYGIQNQRQPIPPSEPTYSRVPDTTVPSAPGTPESMCYGSASTIRTNPSDQTLLRLLTANEPARSYFTSPPTLHPSTALSSVTSDVIAAPAQPLQRDPSEYVVVKDGCVFTIRYVDEPVAEDVLLERTNAEEFCHDGSLASITNDLSMQLDDSMLPGVAHSIADEHGDEDSVRDWINYDELPLLLNKQKQQAAPTVDHISRHSSSETRGDVERCKQCHKPMNITETTTDVCCCAGGIMHPFPTALEPTPVTMVPEFSHYCVECEKFFPASECLQEHMELNHRLIDDSLPMVTTIPRATYGEPEGIGSGGGYVWPCSTIVDSTNAGPKMPFFCDLCNISFNLADSYFMHNYSVHGRMGSNYR